jgi:hypothetical protein
MRHMKTSFFCGEFACFCVGSPSRTEKRFDIFAKEIFRESCSRNKVVIAEMVF